MDTDMVRILKRTSMVLGIVVVIGSIQFSYDGFDQNISGMNSNYTTFAVIIGYTLAIVFNLIEFIFGTNYKHLNWTLRSIGVFAYFYSIYTNYLGIKHLLGASEFMAWALAMIMDIFPEPAIAWAMGEALTGDFLGNLFKIVFGDRKKPQQIFSAQSNKSQYNPQHRPIHVPQSTVHNPQQEPDHKQDGFYPMNYGED